MMGNLPLRLRLLLLVAGTMLPLILFSAGVVYFNHMRETEAAFARVVETVRSVRLALDGEMQGLTAALEVLAGSEALRRGDMDSFRRNADAFLKRFPVGEASISLAQRNGEQIFNSNAPDGAKLPQRTNQVAIDEVFRTGQPFYSDLFIGSVTGRRLVTISVPIFRDGKIFAELSFNPPFDKFQAILERQRLSSDWTISIFDRAGVNFARLPNPEATIGQRASPTLFAEMFKAPEAKVNTVSLEGVPLLTAYSHSPLSGWIVAAGISLRTINAPLWRSLAITAVIGTGLLVIGLTFALGMARQIARGEAMHNLLVNELNHRVKNTLATVQSIGTMTFREQSDPAEARRKFDARLAALGRAHDILSDEKWGMADLREIVESVLEPYGATNRQRLHLSGPDIRVAPRTALMISMALHELATNAAKYGALSNETGEVLIDWAPEPNSSLEMLRLNWRERGGPPVKPVDREGFGTRLIRDGFAEHLGGGAELDYSPTGVACTMHCPRV